MDSAIISAIIGASATVIGAVIGRSEYFDKFLHGQRSTNLADFSQTKMCMAKKA